VSSVLDRDFVYNLLIHNWSDEDVLELDSYCQSAKIIPESLDFGGFRVGPYVLYPEDGLRVFRRCQRLGDGWGNHVSLFADGSGTTAGNATGIGVTILRGETPWVLLSEHYPNGTNNTAELMAILRGLQEVGDIRVHVDVYSDSMYALDMASNRKRPKANADLIQRLRYEVQLRQQYGRVTFNHVFGHSGVTMNELCDELASLARRKWNSHE
jgi:ribonuclease HI